MDPFELNPVIWQESFNAGYMASRYAGGGKSRRLGSLWGLIRLSLRSINAWRKLSVPPAAADGEIVWIVRTRNQRAAMEPIAAAMGQSEAFEAVVGNYQISRYGLRVSVFFLPILTYRWIRASPRQRRSMRDGIEAYLATYGEYVAARRSFKRERPAVVVLSNDHVGFYNAIRLAAQHAGIPTVYVQHACVADYFPPLRHDYALLDGRDAAEKYLSRSTESTVALIGIAKLDQMVETRRSCGLPLDRAIGICFNALDDVEFMVQALLDLRKAFPSRRLIMRLHPATPAAIRNQMEDRASRLAIETSDARKVDAIEFVCSLAVMVCGASSIILEAAAAGVPSVALFSERASDVYGFVKAGLCESVEKSSDLGGAIERAFQWNSDDLRKKVGFYSEGFDQPGHRPSSQIAAETLRRIVQGVDIGGRTIMIRNHPVRVWSDPPPALGEKKPTPAATA